MKKNALCLLLLIISFSASAGSASGGATEVTQIVNMTQLVLQYAQQIQQYGTQLQQYQAQLQNMAQNPASALGGNVGQVIQGVGSIMSATNSMGSTMAQIDANFAQQYRSPIAGNYADQYRTWTNTSVGTLGAALSAAGMHRDAYRSDADALQALYNKSQSSTGTVAAVQQLSALTSMQVQQTQKLGDLMSSQNVAASTYMASQTSKEQSANGFNEAVQQGFQSKKAPPLDAGTKTYKKLDLYQSNY
jgi:P-type conjugative transfer protein TrbJ